MNSNEIFKFNLGDEVKDIITNFKGIIQSRTEYLTGCNIYGVQSQELSKEGELRDWIHFDENRIKLVKKEKIKLNTSKKIEIKKDISDGGPLNNNQYAYQKLYHIIIK